MKLDTETITYMQNIVDTAKMVGIDSIIIEPGLIRAIDDNRCVVLHQTEDVEDLPFGSVGLNRISVFTSRLDIAKTQEKFTVDAVEGTDDFAKSITMKGKGIKIDYRCANPSSIRAPKIIHDTMKYRVDLNSDAVLLLQKGQAAMGAPETVAIISNKDGVAFELVDVNSHDVFSHTFTDKVHALNGSTKMTFAHRYPVKVLLTLFKHDSEGSFDIGEKGILHIDVNGLGVYVLPQI